MTIAYTLINISYLPVAKTLADSFMYHNPDIPFYLCLFDDKNDIQDPIFLDYNIYDKNNLNKQEFDDMRGRYDNFSMACALKPFFAEALIRDFSPSEVIYIDADTMLFQPMTDLQQLLQQESLSIVLTGHQYKIIENENELHNNLNIRKYGLYNAGFLAFKNDEKGIMFLNWWKRILFTKCIKDPENGIYYDQTWLDLVPIYFGDHCHILKHLGYNVAYWNLEERKVSVTNNEYIINEDIPLVFYHFARFQYYNNIYIDGFKIKFDHFPEIKVIFDDYKDKLKDNLYEKYIPFSKPKVITLREKIKTSLKFRLPLLIDKL